jgi:uncharacterized protein YcfJ
METTSIKTRIHPLMAAAAVSLTVVSLVGAAAIAGLLPNSHGAVATDQARADALNSSLVPQAQQSSMLSVAKQNDDYTPAVHHVHQRHHTATRVNTERGNTSYEVAQAERTPQYSQYSPAPVYQQATPVAQNSPLGIGLGALVGGLVGSRVGGGNGRTFAEIAGAIGGGYVGNEIAKRNQ